MLVRTLTALLLIGGFLAALFWLDPRWFAGLVALIVGAAGHEWARLCALARARSAFYAIVCVAVFVGAYLTGSAFLSVAFGIGTVLWIAAVPVLLATGLAPVAPLLPLIGLLVIVPAGLAMTAIPPWLLLAALVIVWVSDTAAYFGGRAFGRRKLAPSISPGKTWEGFYCGLGAVLIYAIIYGALPSGSGARPVTEAGWGLYLAAAAVLCVVGVLGDLFESALKRRAGVKDSGKLLPGHGGVLDRIDSALAVLPVAAFLLQWIRPG